MSYATEVAADSPTAWWRLDDSSGTSAVDNSGNGHAGTYEGGFTLSATSLLDTDADKAVSLNGTTGDVLIASVPSLATATSTISLEAWFKTSSATGTIIGCRNSVSGNQILTLGVNSGQILIQVRDNANVGLLNFTTTDCVVNDGNRHHIVATRDSAKVWTIYLDGVICLVKSDTMTSACSSLDWAYIGRERRNAVFFNGTIDEVAIYNGTVLTAARVAAHYIAGVNDATTSPTDLYASIVLGDGATGYWRLDTAGILVPDISGGGQHGALRNGATANAVGLVPNTTDTATSLDGTNDRIDLPAGTVAIPTTSSPVSIELWMKMTSNVSSRTVFSARKWADTNPNVELFVEASSGSHVISGVARGSSIAVCRGSATVDDGNPHHIVLTLDASKNVRLYVDGALDGGPTAQTISAGLATLDAISIGCDRLDSTTTSGHPGPSFIGTIDDVSVYNGIALTATQVAQHYLAGVGRYPPRMPAANHQNPAVL